MISEHSMCYAGEQGMVDEAQKALEEAEALKRVDSLFLLQLKFHVCLFKLFLSNKYVQCRTSLRRGRSLLQGIQGSIPLLMFAL